jgi:hypothetical protein
MTFSITNEQMDIVLEQLKNSGVHKIKVAEAKIFILAMNKLLTGGCSEEWFQDICGKMPMFGYAELSQTQQDFVDEVDVRWKEMRESLKPAS